jgi:hypothetical protein
VASSGWPGLIVKDRQSVQEWNRYTLVLNNPLTNIDPLGLWDIGVEYRYKKNKDGSDKLLRFRKAGLQIKLIGNETPSHRRRRRVAALPLRSSAPAAVS